MLSLHDALPCWRVAGEVQHVVRRAGRWRGGAVEVRRQHAAVAGGQLEALLGRRLAAQHRSAVIGAQLGALEGIGEHVEGFVIGIRPDARSEEQTSELQSLMRNSYAVFCM